MSIFEVCLVIAFHSSTLNTQCLTTTLKQTRRFAADLVESATEKSSWRFFELALAVGGKVLRDEQRTWQQANQQQQQQNDEQKQQKKEQEPK